MIYDPSAATLAAYHDSGIPLIVWLSVYHNPGWYEWDSAGDRYKIVPNLHVLVAHGHDDSGVYLSDPGTGWYDHVSWDWFLTAWGIMDGMALAVYPI